MPCRLSRNHPGGYVPLDNREIAKLDLQAHIDHSHSQLPETPATTDKVDAKGCR